MKKALVVVSMLCFSALYAQSQTKTEKDPPPPSPPEYPLLKTPPPPFHPLFKKKHAVLKKSKQIKSLPPPDSFPERNYEIKL